MKIKSLLTMTGILMVVLLGFTIVLAATKNPPPGAAGYTPMVLTLPGAYTTTAAGVVKFKAPAGYRIITANANARAVTGTNPTMKVNVKNGTFTTYSSTLTAAGVKDLTAASDTRITDEGAVAVDLTFGGTSPSFTDLTVFLLLKRL